MLSHKYLEKVRRLEAQYGPSEGCFSPRFHLDVRNQTRSDAGAVLQEPNDSTQKTLHLGYILHPDGDVTIAKRDQPIPERAKWIDDARK